MIYSQLTYLVSMLRWRCSLRYHSSLLFLGTKSETASAISCHAWTKAYCGGLDLHESVKVGQGWDGGVGKAAPPAPLLPPPPALPPALVGDPAPAPSQANSDCVAHNSSCWKANPPLCQFQLNPNLFSYLII